MKFQEYRELLEDWEDCQKCPLGKRAYRHVMGKGNLNADFLFIGEGPGRTEDLQGVPFSGQAGQVLDAALSKAHHDFRRKSFFANLLACRPCDSVRGGNRAPENSEVIECSRRLIKLINIVNPKVIIFLGAIPASYASIFTEKYEAIWHPSYILRSGGEKSRLFPKYVDNLRRIYAQIFPAE